MRVDDYYIQHMPSNKVNCSIQENGVMCCDCETGAWGAPNTNGILETILGQPNQPITVVGFEMATQSIVMMGVAVVVAGLIIKHV